MKVISVIEEINRGGFGIIDRVVCEDGNQYARKTFSPSDQFKADTALCDKLKIRFIREVKTQIILPQEYFMPILFNDLNASSPYFIMPLAEDVYDKEIERCRVSKKTPNGLGDILNALEFLHDKGLVHRDLKPQNILKHNGSWKLADFGLISQDREILSQTITTSKQAFGTTMYCAPEQVMEFSRITPQADIYSFGAILHDIFTDGNRVPYSELKAEGTIGQIIEKCTKHKKEQRFSSIKAIRSKLLSFLSSNSGETLSQSDKEWQDRLKEVSNWDDEILERFIFHMKKNLSGSTALYKIISDEILEKFRLIDKNLFYDFALSYLDWVFINSFTFSYCDVVVNNVYFIYKKSKEIDLKSKCVISAAELGKSHNRWYVMGYVVLMSGPEIDDNLAFRISLDIELEERNKINFERCVSRINKNISSYHPRIRDILC